jgi:uncharacterized membrane protein
VACAAAARRLLLAGTRYTYQWSSMFVLAYFTEGVMRAWGDRGASQALAGAEVLLTVVFFASVVGYARLTRQHA